jgi:CubicO group peptidase (beta-lactamase class C family)
MAALVAALALLASLAPAQPAIVPGIEADLDRLAAAEFAKDGVGALTIGMVSGGALAWTRSYGFADIAARTPATADTAYRIGSITKQFTAVMLLQLVEQGTVRLSDPVEKYLPEINRINGRAPHAPPVTFAQLATMTSGIAREPEDLPAFLKGPVSSWESVLLAALARTAYDHEPGTRYLYSNIGYAILGAAVGRAAGRPYVEYVRDRILAPLGMTHTDFEATATIQPTLAKGYELANGRLDADTPAREHAGRGYKVPNGALYSTVGDLARFVAFELGEGPVSVLRKETIQDNLSRVGSATSDLRSGYGIGFQVQRRGELVQYGHSGSVAGYRAAVLFDPVSRTGVIVLRNVGGGKINISGLAAQALEMIARATSSDRHRH